MKFQGDYGIITFYQPSSCKVHERLVLKLLYVFLYLSVCLYLSRAQYYVTRCYAFVVYMQILEVLRPSYSKQAQVCVANYTASNQSIYTLEVVTGSAHQKTAKVSSFTVLRLFIYLPMQDESVIVLQLQLDMLLSGIRWVFHWKRSWLVSRTETDSLQESESHSNVYTGS